MKAVLLVAFSREPFVAGKTDILPIVQLPFDDGSSHGADQQGGFSAEDVAKKILAEVAVHPLLKTIAHANLRIHDIMWVAPDRNPIPEEIKRTIGQEILKVIRPDLIKIKKVE